MRWSNYLYTLFKYEVINDINAIVYEDNFILTKCIKEKKRILITSFKRYYNIYIIKRSSQQEG